MRNWLMIVLCGSLILSACNSGTSGSGYVPPVNTIGGYSYGSAFSGEQGYFCGIGESPTVYTVMYSYAVSYTNVSPVAYIEQTGSLPSGWTVSGNCTPGTISANPSCTFTFTESSTSAIATPEIPLQINGSAGAAALSPIPAVTCPGLSPF